jgi:hypothetical protein
MGVAETTDLDDRRMYRRLVSEYGMLHSCGYAVTMFRVHQAKERGTSTSYEYKRSRWLDFTQINLR